MRKSITKASYNEDRGGCGRLESGGDIEKSISMLKDAHTEDPHNQYVLRKLLKSLINNRYYEESLAYCEKYCLPVPSDTGMIYATSFCFKNQGTWKNL
jgi:hypothetical protein